MKSFIIWTALLLLGNSSLFATAQKPDKIIFEGKEYILHSNPMEQYFEQFPDKRPESEILSTGLWRGYVATFIVKEDEIYLKDIEIQIDGEELNETYNSKWKSVIKELLTEQEELKIDWLTGILVIPDGKMINYVHMGYASGYSNYILLEVENGIVNRFKKFPHEEYQIFKKKQFEVFKKSEEYRKLVEELKNEDNYDEEFIESFLEDYVISYTTKFVE